MDIGQTAAFAAAALVMELTPGPNMAYLALVSAGVGRRAGAAAVAGVTLGLLVYLLATAAGLAQLAARWPVVLQTLSWAGVAYLLWLAWEAWTQAGRQAEAPRAAPLGVYFRRGLIANLLNAKAALLYVALLPGFLDPARSAAGQALALGGVHLAISLVVHLGIVGFAGAAGRRLGSDGARRLGRLMALALVGVACWVAVQAL